MAKVSSVEKNKHRTSLANQFQAKRAKLKAIIMDRNISESERFDSTLRLARIPRNSAKSRIRNRCEITGRSRGYYRKFKLSRIALRNYASFGMIPGLVKASW